MSVDLTNKIVLITGASSGIGAACATAFAKQGCRLLLTARRVERLEALAESLQQTYHVDVKSLVLDVTNKNLIAKTFNDLAEEWRDIDIVINNAGLALDLTAFQEGDVHDWEVMMDTNVKGILYITRALINNMLHRNQGHIINIGSIAGHQAYANGTVYCATKAAVKMLTDGLKHDLLGTQIRVTAIDPGLVETEFSEVRFKGDQDRAAQVYADIESLLPEDIAELIVFSATRPQRVNINRMIVMPTCQASVFHVDRQ